MGVTIRCKKTWRGIDLSYSGFDRLRLKVSELCGEPWYGHYNSLLDKMVDLGPDDGEFFKIFDQNTQKILEEKKISVKIVDFCLQNECKGSIRYGACKQILKVIGDYDDNVCYGYVGRPDCAMFRDFKAILQECVENKCDMVWS